jgi:hypothetical protein
VRSDHARGRFFWMRDVVERNAARCPWLAEKLLACRSGAPMPAAAMAPDVTRHDVNWGAEGARRNERLQLMNDGFGLRLPSDDFCWAQGPVGVTSGKHYFSVSVNVPRRGCTRVGWVSQQQSLGAAYALRGGFCFGSAPLTSPGTNIPAPAKDRPCVVGCLLDLDATPARMTVFVAGKPLEAQCEYDFPKDGRAWFPSVSLCEANEELHSCAM